MPNLLYSSINQYDVGLCSSSDVTQAKPESGGTKSNLKALFSRFSQSQVVKKDSNNLPMTSTYDAVFSNGDLLGVTSMFT